MDDFMDKRIFNTPVNGINFYCEIRGQGPALVLVPPGLNDCGLFEQLAQLLSDEFTVLTFDMRGGTRSTDPAPKKVTPKVLADDIAGIIESLDIGPTSVYGCSSGGQAVLALGKYHPHLARNLLVHEAALQRDTPLENCGFDFFVNNATFEPVVNEIHPGIIWGVGNLEKWMNLDEGCRDRIRKNNDFWFKYYRGTVDMDVYTEDDFRKMPPTIFSVGAWTPSWLVYANLETAKRGNCPVTWLNCAHHPELICPEELASHIRSSCKIR
jgi:pimeloyl-ACP methyl ester carboxylesterase